MSSMRKHYFFKLAVRCAVLILSVYASLTNPQYFDILVGMNFFSSPSLLHLLWTVWMIDMLLQIVPLKSNIPLGSQKLFKHRFKPIDAKDPKSLKRYTSQMGKYAYLIFFLWVALTAVLGTLYRLGIINNINLFVISVFFYVCDLICVLIWCPFRLILKTRCCTTCRIFNWDHLMMFSPLIFIGGFYCTSLVIFAFAAWMVWEICIFIYPERFWEQTNLSLKCSECTDKLCTQYCRK